MSNKVVWARPQDPVMAKTDGWASSLILGEPASVRFVQYTMQRALGHSEKAAAQGLTKDYIGPILEDTWALRVKAAPIKLSRQHRQPSTLQGL
jgi:hypothetical protein